ncbi:hypothetical protein [Streptomyces sp. AcH 505]
MKPAQEQTGFTYWISWECQRCGAKDDIQGTDKTGDVIESIEHDCATVGK